MTDRSGERTWNGRPWPAPELLGEPVRFSQRSVIVEAGSPVRVLYLIETGVAGRFIEGDEGEVLDSVRGTGWLMGVVPALTARQYGRIVALTDCVLRPLTIGIFRKSLDRAAVALWLAELLADDVVRHQARVSALAQGSLRTAIEDFFLDVLTMAGKVNRDGSIRLTFDLSVADLARLLGSTREHTSRTLSELADAGSLVRVKGWFVAPAGGRLNARIRKRSGT